MLVSAWYILHQLQRKSKHIRYFSLPPFNKKRGVRSRSILLRILPQAEREALDTRTGTRQWSPPALTRPAPRGGWRPCNATKLAGKPLLLWRYLRQRLCTTFLVARGWPDGPRWRQQRKNKCDVHACMQQAGRHGAKYFCSQNAVCDSREGTWKVSCRTILVKNGWYEKVSKPSVVFGDDSVPAYHPAIQASVSRTLSIYLSPWCCTVYSKWGGDGYYKYIRVLTKPAGGTWSPRKRLPPCGGSYWQVVSGKGTNCTYLRNVDSYPPTPENLGQRH